MVLRKYIKIVGGRKFLAFPLLYEIENHTCVVSSNVLSDAAVYFFFIFEQLVLSKYMSSLILQLTSWTTRSDNLQTKYSWNSYLKNLFFSFKLFSYVPIILYYSISRETNARENTGLGWPGKNISISISSRRRECVNGNGNKNLNVHALLWRFMKMVFCVRSKNIKKNMFRDVIKAVIITHPSIHHIDWIHWNN